MELTAETKVGQTDLPDPWIEAVELLEPTMLSLGDKFRAIGVIETLPIVDVLPPPVEWSIHCYLASDWNVGR